jgi:hypothetical protein
MKRTYGPVPPETRFSFWKAFGVTPAEQVVIEDFYKEFKLQLVDGDFCPHAILPL